MSAVPNIKRGKRGNTAVGLNLAAACNCFFNPSMKALRLPRFPRFFLSLYCSVLSILGKMRLIDCHKSNRVKKKWFAYRFPISFISEKEQKLVAVLAE